MNTYSKLYRINTVQELICRYAPEFENNTAAYIEYVSNQAGIGWFDKYDMKDKEVIGKIVRAICHFESHYKLSNDTFANAYKSALAVAAP